jgi:hypothetical protein
LEAIQRCAARFVMRRYRNTSSVSDMINELRWLSLESRRRTARLAMLYRIQHDLVSIEAIKAKLQPLPARQRKATTNSSPSLIAVLSTSRHPSSPAHLKTGTTSPKTSLRPRPSTPSCQGPLVPSTKDFFFLDQKRCRPPQSDRIIKMLIAVTPTEEEEEQFFRRYLV